MENKKTPRKVKGFFELKHSQRGERKRKYQSAFQEASSCVHSDISSIKVQFNFDNGHVLSFFPRKVSPDENASLEDEGVKKSQDLEHILEFVLQHQKYQKYIENCQKYLLSKRGVQDFGTKTVIAR